ncbi:MAG: cupin domain-containing protein [Selenomonadaceae bacterium]|nr:cupin domain-containing protein [Selenomonadaceae bacterium]
MNSTLKNFAAKIFVALILFTSFQVSAADNSERIRELKEIYSLQGHEEDGDFAEVYTSPVKKNRRPIAGSIYFLLVGKDVSHFHQLDCDELWLYHEGCGLKIFVLRDGKVDEIILGTDVENSARHMAIIPAGSIFAAENLDADGYTLVSCVTAPRFTYKGFRLIERRELKKLYPKLDEKILRLAYEKSLTE